MEDLVGIKIELGDAVEYPLPVTARSA